MSKHIFSLLVSICLILPVLASEIKKDENTGNLLFSALQGEEMLNHIGEGVLVEGVVTQVSEGKTGKVSFINFTSYNPQSRDFHAVVFDKVIQRNPEAWSTFLKSLPGKTIKVTGSLREYKGRPQIEVSTMEQIEVVDN